MTPSCRRLATLRDRHLGERAVLVANGPSLNDMDLSFLRRTTTIGLNKIYLGLQRFRFIPKYYVAVNEKVLSQSVVQIKSLNCVKFLSSKAAQQIPADGLTYHIETSNPHARFCGDVSRGLHEGWTVTYAALQIAYFLGFSEVVMIGLDHRYEFSGLPNEAHQLAGDDPNHFSPDYFGHGQHWDNPDLAHSEESFRIARAEYEKVGRRILDATLNGACTAFEKVDYRSYFGVGC